MNYKTTLLSLTLLLVFSGCSDSKDEKTTAALVEQSTPTHAKVVLHH